MTNALKKSLLQQLEQAEESYNRELENGGSDTEEHRKQVAEIKRNMESLDANESAQHEAAEAEVEAIMAEQAERAVQTEKDALHTYLSEQSGITIPEVNLPLSVAMNVQRAGHALQESLESTSAAKARVDRLQTRKMEIEATRQAVVRNRMAGNGDDERDGQRLSLCDNDLNGLAPMIDEARAGLQAAQAALQQAQQV